MAELFATNRYPGDGVTTQFTIAFQGGFMDRTHVKAYIEDATTLERTDVTVTTGMFLSDSLIDLGVSAPIGSNMVLYRDTPKSGPLVDFEGGSRITEANLDKVARQAVLIGAEIYDATNLEAVSDLTAIANSIAATAAAIGTAAYDTFEGDGSTDLFPLASAPGVISNLWVYVDGLALVPDIDFTYVPGASEFTTTVPPANGADIVARYQPAALLVGNTDAAGVSFNPGGGAALTDVQLAIRMQYSGLVSVKGYPYYAKGDGITDDTTAIQNALTGAYAVYFPPGNYLVSASLILRSGNKLFGSGRHSTIITSAVLNASLFKTTASYVGFLYMGDMQLIGNGLTGGSGNGHALNLVDPAIGSGSYTPAQSMFERLYIRNFRGTDTRDNAATQINSAAVACVDGLGNVFRDISVENCGNGFFMHRTQNCRIFNPLVTGCQDWGLMSYDNENLVVYDGDINTCGVDGVTNATGAIETGMYTGNVLTARDEAFIMYGMKQKGAAGVAQTHAFVTTANIRDCWIRPDHIVDKDFIGILITNPIDVSIDGNVFSPTSGAPYSATRKIYNVSATVASTHNIAKMRVNNNTFRTQGGTLVGANVKLMGAAGATRMEGLEIVGNAFGTPQNTIGATTIDADVLFSTGTFKDCTIERNNHYASTATTVTAHYQLTAGTFVTTSNRLINNSFSSQAIGAIPGVYSGLTASRTSLYGTFTPVLEGISSAGVGTYSVQKGTYAREGKLMHISIALTWSAHTGTGSLRITGLPAAAKTDANIIQMFQCVASELTFTGTFIAAGVVSGASNLNLYTVASGAAIANIAMDTAGSLWITGTYEVE